MKAAGLGQRTDWPAMPPLTLEERLRAAIVRAAGEQAGPPESVRDAIKRMRERPFDLGARVTPEMMAEKTLGEAGLVPPPPEPLSVWQAFKKGAKEQPSWALALRAAKKKGWLPRLFQPLREDEEALPVPAEGILPRIAETMGGIAADPATYAGGLLGKRLATGLAARAAAKPGMEQLARLAARKGVQRGITTGTTLGTIGMARDIPTQIALGEKYSPLETAAAGIKGGLTGFLAGMAGAIPYAGLPAEIGVFGTVAPVLEGEAPTLEGYIEAAGMVGGMRGAMGGMRAAGVGRALWKASRGQKLTPDETKFLADVPLKDRVAIRAAAAKAALKAVPGQVRRWTPRLSELIGKQRGYEPFGGKAKRARSLYQRMAAAHRGGRVLPERLAEKRLDVYKKLEFPEDPKGAEKAGKRIHYAIVGDIPLESLPPEWAEWGRSARRLQDQASTRYAEELEAAASAESNATRAETLRNKAKTIRGNIGTYLHELRIPPPRTPAKRMEPELLMPKRDKWAIEVGKRWIKFDTEAEAREAYADARTEAKGKLLKEKAKKAGVTPDAIRMAAVAGKVRLIAPIPESIRQKIFYRDPRVSWTLSYIKTINSANNLRFFRRLDKAFGRELPEELADASEATKQQWADSQGLELVKGAPDRLGPIANKYLPREIARDVNEVVRIPGKIESFYRAYISLYKTGLTVLNFETHFHNTFGNMIFAFWDGNSIWNPANFKYYYRAMAELMKGPEKSELIRYMIRRNALGTEYFGAEIATTYRDLMESRSSWETMMRMIQRLAKEPGKVYALEDQWFKVASQFKHMDEGMSRGRALQEVLDQYPNYADLPRSVRVLRQSPLGSPFLSFKVAASKIAYNTARKRPVRLAISSTFPIMVSEMSRHLLGMEDEEWNMINERRTPFQVILPMRDERGGARMLDLTAIYPLGHEAAELQRGRPLTATGLLQMPPLAGVLDVRTGIEHWSGRRIYQQDEPFTSKAAKSVKYLLVRQSPMPGWTTYGRERINEALKGTAEQSVLEAVGDSILGIELRRPYVRGGDVRGRLQELAMEDPHVDRFIAALIDRQSIRKMPMRKLSAALGRSPAYAELENLFNTAYRYLGGARRGEAPPIKPRGILQALTGKGRRADEFYRTLADLEAQEEEGTELGAGSRALLNRLRRSRPEMDKLLLAYKKTETPKLKKAILDKIAATARLAFKGAPVAARRRQFDVVRELFRPPEPPQESAGYLQAGMPERPPPVSPR